MSVIPTPKPPDDPVKIACIFVQMHRSKSDGPPQIDAMFAYLDLKHSFWIRNIGFMPEVGQTFMWSSHHLLGAPNVS